jgi:hypothetical protein
LTYLPQPAGLKNAQDEVNDIRTPWTNIAHDAVE